MERTAEAVMDGQRADAALKLRVLTALLRLERSSAQGFTIHDLAATAATSADKVAAMLASEPWTTFVDRSAQTDHVGADTSSMSYRLRKGRRGELLQTLATARADLGADDASVATRTATDIFAPLSLLEESLDSFAGSRTAAGAREARRDLASCKSDLKALAASNSPWTQAFRERLFAAARKLAELESNSRRKAV